MKSLFRLVFLLFVITSCSKKQEAEQAAASDEWKEMESFHMIMAEAYHPLKDSANLAPAKSRAEALASEAEKWAAAELPEKVDTEEVKSQLIALKSTTRSFADQVKANAPDADLSIALEALHEQFHLIMEAWHSSQEHEENH
ncbi:MAG: hypothetical protein K2U26_18565 [Cyclobacteriaceae bacterium]|nr:hypothetical protein [Cyclobacteriaceae bacterium]